MFDINAVEFIVLLVVALVVVGPERLPQYAQQLGQLVRGMRKMAKGAREQVRTELGSEFDDVDWQKLDPRQYDPRRIVREALSDAWDDDDDTPAKPVKPARRPGARPGGFAAHDGDVDGPIPFDSDAT